MKIMVTGGAGYIGSHTVLALLEAGHDVAVLDNLANSSRVSLDRVSELAGGRRIAFHETDILDARATTEVFQRERPDAVIHFAGLKAVGESAEKPLWSYRTNVTGTLNPLAAMEASRFRVPVTLVR